MSDFPDFICVHCDKSLMRDGAADRENFKFLWGRSVPHCLDHLCTDLRVCNKTTTKKGKRFLKDRTKAVKESGLKRDPPRAPSSCEECQNNEPTTKYVMRRRKWLCKNCRDDKDVTV